MRNVLKISVGALLLLFGALAAAGQAYSVPEYRKSSVYSILIQHSGQKYVDDIREVYFRSPLSDKFCDHSLSVVALETDAVKYENVRRISDFLERNNVARRLVAKWFDRDRVDGTFSMDLLARRGFYEAGVREQEVSSMLKRGSAMLEDASQEMIGNTFVVVYDIIYIDKEEKAQKAKAVLGVAASLLRIVGAVAGNTDVRDVANTAAVVTTVAALVSDMIAGFRVKICAHLYQLEWNSRVAEEFYASCWSDRGAPDAARAQRWNELDGLFKLKYIASSEVASGETVARGLYSPNDVIRKVVNRTMNLSVAKLQKDNEVFRVKVPVSEVGGSKIFAPVGKKEGVEAGDRFEVLEMKLDAGGTARYIRRGVVQAVNVWDNRYMSADEGAENADLMKTEFRQVSGSGIYPGMILRQGTSRTINGKVISASDGQ